jgi:hypothetical protein
LLYSAGDELVHVTSAKGMADAYAATDNEYQFFLHPAAEHLTYAALDDWTKEAAYTKDLKRSVNPPRVSFRTAEFLGSPTFGISQDKAYWVSQIRGREGGIAYQDVDLTTAACGGSVPVLEDTTGAGPDPVPWISQGQEAVSTAPGPSDHALAGALTNVASLEVDVAAACLAGRPVSYSLTTDGPVTVSLSDGRSVRLPEAGTHVGEVAGAAPSGTSPGGGTATGTPDAAAPSPDVGPLPATGLPAPVPVLALLPVVAGLALRRRFDAA